MTLFVAVIEIGAQSVLLSSAADRSATVATQVARELESLSNSPFGPVSVRTALADPSFLDEFAGTGLFVEAFNEFGKPIGKSTNLGTADLVTSGLAPWKPRASPPNLRWGLRQNDGQRSLVNWQTIHDNNHTAATVYVAQSLGPIDAILRSFRLFLLGGLLAALCFIALASSSLARAALGPIGEITQAAGEISGEDLAKRLNWKGRADELGALAQTFDDMLARLEAAFARERRFIADASHELKTPLTVINANAQMLTRWGTRDEAIMREALATIQQESATMARVINAMLTLAKTDNPEALTFERVNLRDLVRDVSASLQPNAAAKGIALSVDADADAAVRGEAGLLRQLVTNLTENAIKFTDAGSVTLGVANDNGTAQLLVQDTGRGIPDDAVPHIFDRFYRADPARSRMVEGTGLGLAVVNNIVKVHRGQIRVASRLGKGTTFTVTLPGHGQPEGQPSR